MTSFRKRGRVWYYRSVDSDGAKVGRKGCPDRRVTEQVAAAAAAAAARVRSGFVHAHALAHQRQAARPLAAHLDDFEAFLLGKGDSAKHAKLYTDRARRLAALACGASIGDVDPGRRAPRAARRRAAAALVLVLETGRLADLRFSSVQ